MIEQFRDRIDQFFPFDPPAPVEELLPAVAEFLYTLLQDRLIHIQHFGSTAETAANLNRSGYHKPHRGSDIDLAVVVADDCVVWQTYSLIRDEIRSSSLPQNLFEFHVVNRSIYENASVDGHPSTALYGHAQAYGKAVIF